VTRAPKKKAGGRAVARPNALARPGDPLVDPLTGEVYAPIAESEEDKRTRRAAFSPRVEDYKPLKKRSVKELPAEPKLLNAIAVVFMYTTLGLGDREIADLLRTDTDEITEIRKHKAYGECFHAVHSEFINSNSDLLASRIAGYATDALETVGDLVTSGKKEETRLRASIDIMDRAGLRPKDQETKQLVQKSELRITIVESAKERSIVEIDTNLED
jgi:hypothetical protein